MDEQLLRAAAATLEVATDAGVLAASLLVAMGCGAVMLTAWSQAPAPGSAAAGHAEPAP